VEEKKSELQTETQKQERIEQELSDQQDSTAGLLREFCEFLGERKKFWLLPIIIIMVLLGALIVFTSSSALAPFIYAIF
jgi:hypothetical protein